MNSDTRPLVALNAHLLSGEASYRSAGISTYIARLLEHLRAVTSPLRYEVLVGEAALPPGFGIPTRRSRWSTRRPERRVFWEQFVLPHILRKMKAALVHAPAFVGPIFSSCPQVVTVHDLSFIHYPEFFRPANRLYLRTLTGLSCRRAAAVIAVSNHTAQDVQQLLRVPAERVFTVPLGVLPCFRPLAEAEVADFRREQALPERFVLYLGTLEPRKNLVRLIRAFGQLRMPDVSLVLAGAKGWYFSEIFAEVERLGLGDRVRFPGYVSSESLPFWYNAATVFAYPSIYEGFGMPVLEAQACGVPVLTSSSTSLPEAGGDAALKVSPRHEDAIAAGLHRLLTDPPLREEMRVEGLAHAAAFSWAETARQTTEVYEWALAQTMQM